MSSLIELKLRPWKSVYKNRVFNLDDVIKVMIERDSLLHGLRLINHVLNKEKEVLFNDGLVNLFVYEYSKIHFLDIDIKTCVP